MTHAPLILNTCVAELGLEDDAGRRFAAADFGSSPTAQMCAAVGACLCVAVGDRAQQQIGMIVLGAIQRNIWESNCSVILVHHTRKNGAWSKQRGEEEQS